MLSGASMAPAMKLLLASLICFASLLPAAMAPACVVDSDCDNANPCDGLERCLAGQCVGGAAIPCDDGDPCTLDVCDDGLGCRHAEDLCPSDCTGLGDGERCADGTVCTVGDACSGGVCVAGPPRSCPQEDECTTAVCDVQLGCVYTEEFVSAPCVPDCTGTVADFTRCPGDENPCTIDACLPSVDFSETQCVAGLLLKRQCGDGDVCNGAEWCSPTLGCQAGPALACDDGNACNGTETCDSLLGCQAGIPLPDGAACDDGLLCTQNDGCSSAQCLGQPVGPADCDDGNATTTDQCREGVGCLACTAAGARAVRFRWARSGKNDGRFRARGGWTPLAGATLAPDLESAVLAIDLYGASVYRATMPAGTRRPVAG